MKISASILDIKEPKNMEVNKLSKLDIDYIHVDVMDGIFVENKTIGYNAYKLITENALKPLDVHLMVSDIKEYIDSFCNLNPKYITFHYEAASDVMGIINYIKSNNIKVGLSIKPSTKVNEIIDYLKYVDLVLVMSVEPGLGGQSFIESSEDKINELYILRENNNYSYEIEVDGGINNITIKNCLNADICVVGSYITKHDYEEQIKSLIC